MAPFLINLNHMFQKYKYLEQAVVSKIQILLVTFLYDYNKILNLINYKITAKILEFRRGRSDKYVGTLSDFQR